MFDNSSPRHHSGGSGGLSVLHANTAAAIGETLRREQPGRKPPGHAARWELERRRLAGTVLDPKAGRRWALQRKAAQILREVEIRVREGEEYRAFKYRVSLCNRGINGWTDSGGVEVFASPDGLRAEFRGVQTCGSVWHCPVCAPKIARERVDEINKAMRLWQNGHKGKRGRIFFGTFTYQHGREIAGRGQLAGQLKRFSEALSELKRDRPYREIIARVGYKGAIRGLETTYGEANGWHNHTHEIMFVGSGLGRSLRDLRRLYYSRAALGASPARDAAFERQRVRERIKWAASMATQHVLRGVRKAWARKLIACDMAGLAELDAPAERRKKIRDLLTRCYVVQHGAHACDYVAKFGKEPEGQRGRWGLASELARSHLKAKARAGDIGASADGGLPARCAHASPWELLNDALDGDELSADLFREYGQGFHRKRQLYFSPGLRPFFDLVEVEDEELSNQPDRKCSMYVGAVTRDQWRAVLVNDSRFTVLCIAARDGREHLLEYLESLERSASRAPIIEEAEP